MQHLLVSHSFIQRQWSDCCWQIINKHHQKDLLIGFNFSSCLGCRQSRKGVRAQKAHLSNRMILCVIKPGQNCARDWKNSWLRCWKSRRTASSNHMLKMFFLRHVCFGRSRGRVYNQHGLTVIVSLRFWDCFRQWTATTWAHLCKWAYHLRALQFTKLRQLNHDSADSSSFIVSQQKWNHWWSARQTNIPRFLGGAWSVASWKEARQIRKRYKCCVKRK